MQRKFRAFRQQNSLFEAPSVKQQQKQQQEKY